jgi:hypothetical protein
VPGLFACPPGHLSRFEKPRDDARASSYEAGPCVGIARQVQRALARIAPGGAVLGLIAGAVAQIVDTPFGERPFRVHVDPSEDGAAVTFPVFDRIRDDMLRRTGLADLLRPARHQPQPPTMPAGDAG